PAMATRKPSAATLRDETVKHEHQSGWAGLGKTGLGKKVEEPRSAHRARVAASATSAALTRTRGPCFSPPTGEGALPARVARPITPSRPNQCRSGNT
ncbi:Hypothetical predicted protein, partial [Marmota monax]